MMIELLSYIIIIRCMSNYTTTYHLINLSNDIEKISDFDFRDFPLGKSKFSL